MDTVRPFLLGFIITQESSNPRKVVTHVSHGYYGLELRASTSVLRLTRVTSSDMPVHSIGFKHAYQENLIPKASSGFVTHLALSWLRFGHNFQFINLSYWIRVSQIIATGSCFIYWELRASLLGSSHPVFTQADKTWRSKSSCSLRARTAARGVFPWPETKLPPPRGKSWENAT